MCPRVVTNIVCVRVLCANTKKDRRPSIGTRFTIPIKIRTKQIQVVPFYNFKSDCDRVKKKESRASGN